MYPLKMKGPFEDGRQAEGVKPVLLDAYIGANAGRTESPEASMGLVLAAVIIVTTAESHRALTVYRVPSVWHATSTS